MSKSSNWEVMLMLIVIALIFIVIMVVLCRKQNHYGTIVANALRNLMTHRRRRNNLKRRNSQPEPSRQEESVTATDMPHVIVSSPSLEKLETQKASLEQSGKQGSLQVLSLPPSSLSSSWISLEAIEGEYDLSAIGEHTKLRRAASILSVTSGDSYSAVLSLTPTPRVESILAMVEVSFFYDSAKGYLNIGIAYAYGMKSDKFRAFSECYVRIILTPTAIVSDSPPRTQYRTTKVVKTAETMEFLQKFRFDLQQTGELPQGIQLAKIMLELNAYGRAKSHATIAKRETVVDTNILTSNDCRVAMIPLHVPDVGVIKEPPTIGEMLVSLCFQPTSNKLTLILLQLRNLQLSDDFNKDIKTISTRRDRKKLEREEMRGITGNVYLVINGNASGRKKLKETSVFEDYTNRLELNQVVFFQLDKEQIQSAELRILLETVSGNGNRKLAGFFYIGNSASSNGLLHWKYLMSNPRKPFVLWHSVTKFQRPRLSDVTGESEAAENAATEDDISEPPASASQHTIPVPSASPSCQHMSMRAAEHYSQTFSPIRPFTIKNEDEK